MVEVFFDAIASEIKEAVLVIDEKKTVTYMNDKVTEILGWNKKEILGSDFSKFIQIHNQNCKGKRLPIFNRLDSKGDYYLGVEQFVRKDDSYIPLKYKARSIKNSEKHAGWVFFFETANLPARVDSKVKLAVEGRKEDRALIRMFEALSNDEFELYYQPQIDVAKKQIFGAEALIRWKDKETGRLISPAEFIPMAEKTGFIVRLGEEIMRMACKQNKLWQKQNLFQIPISVNISPIQLRHPRFENMIEEILDETGLEPRYLIVEITENISLHKDADLFNKLNKIKKLGVKIALDDFGTGYSSLEHLYKIPIDFLKIDRSFIHDFVENSKCKEITSSIINMAKKLNVMTIAEGVENDCQVDELINYGCDIMQGFNFCKPLPSEQFSQFFMNWQNGSCNK